MQFHTVGSSGNLISVKITGELKKSELDRMQADAVELIKRKRKIKILILLEDFQGWEQGADWEDMTFASKHDKDIEKVAVVGDTGWKDLVYAFLGKGFRPVAIEYFAPTDLKKAQQWLA